MSRQGREGPVPVDNGGAREGATSTYTHVHQASDPMLDDQRSTTSTERTLDYRGRTVLYIYTEASAISFCSASGASYAGNMVVGGYVVRWQYGANERGEPLSEIEPITDLAQQEEISRALWPGPSSRARVSFRTGPGGSPAA